MCPVGSEILTCHIHARWSTEAGFPADEVSALHTPTGTTLRVLATVGRGTQQALESMCGRSDLSFRAHRGRERLDLFPDSGPWTLTAVLVGQVQREAVGPDGFEERVALAIELTTEVPRGE